MTCVPRWRKRPPTQICLLSATPCSILASSHPMTDGSLVPARLLVFRVGTLACAAEVDQVREILPRLPTTRIPGAPPVVAGLVNVRGTLVTVVEGWRALGLPAPPPPPPPPPPHSPTFRNRPQLRSRGRRGLDVYPRNGAERGKHGGRGGGRKGFAPA